jgi:hypothetical protein
MFDRGACAGGESPSLSLKPLGGRFDRSSIVCSELSDSSVDGDRDEEELELFLCPFTLLKLLVVGSLSVAVFMCFLLAHSSITMINCPIIMRWAPIETQVLMNANPQRTF